MYRSPISPAAISQACTEKPVDIGDARDANDHARPGGRWGETAKAQKCSISGIGRSHPTVRARITPADGGARERTPIAEHSSS